MFDQMDLLVFDLDGTLVDSRYDLADAVNYAMEKMGRPPLAYKELPPLLGSGLSYLLQQAAGTTDEQQLAQAKAWFDEYYEQHFADKTRPYDGVMHTLQQLKGKRMAIYSNKMQYFTEKIADKLGFAPFMDIVQGAQPDLYPLKPDPAGLHRILQQLQIAPERAMMVGDSTHDMEAAQAAGMKSCAMTYGYRSREELSAVAPDHILDRFSALLSDK